MIGSEEGAVSRVLEYCILSQESQLHSYIYSVIIPGASLMICTLFSGKVKVHVCVLFQLKSSCSSDNMEQCLEKKAFSCHTLMQTKPSNGVTRSMAKNLVCQSRKQVLEERRIKKKLKEKKIKSSEQKRFERFERDKRQK